MTQPTALEQAMLELVNVERARAGLQPLAFDLDLNAAAEAHSAWMLAADVFSHTGSGGSTPFARMQAAGYPLTGAWTAAENVAWASTRAPDGLADEVALLHANLMNSPGHRANILNGEFREVGVGFETGDFQGWNAAMVTQNFARTSTAPILTGVAFADRDGDRAYDAGEGLGGLGVRAVSSTGQAVTATTYGSGGYDLVLAPGAWTVTFTGAAIAPVTRAVQVGALNTKLDLVDPAASTAPTPAPVPTTGLTLAGGWADDVLAGGAGDDLIRGLGGQDRLSGAGGADRLEGGTGHDRLDGGSGGDLLLGEAGRDTLAGGAGDDRLLGGSEADVFRFAAGSGRDLVLDWQDGVDRLDFTGAGLTLANLAVARGDADRDGAADDVLVTSSLGTVGLVDTSLSAIGGSDFWL